MRAGVAGEVKPLALVAPAPVVLAGRPGSVEDERVVAAAGMIVGAAGRAVRAGVAGEEHPLALVAPAPVRLARGCRPVLDDVVVAASGRVVSSARRAMRAGIAAEEQALTLVAPAPVLVADREVGHHATELRAARRCLRPHAELGEGAPDALPRAVALVGAD